MDTLKLACVSIGSADTSVFSAIRRFICSCQFLIQLTGITLIVLLKNCFVKSLKKYNLIIAGIVNTDMRFVKKFGITDRKCRIFKKLADSSNVIFDLFASPYALERFQPFKNYKSIIISYEDKDLNQELSAQLIFGGISPIGKLPVKASENI